jgi:uncharacterized metal-binding protein YceD (DUF177 family)
MSGEPFSFLVLVARIPPAGKHFSIAPDEAARSAVAQTLHIVEVPRLTAEIDVRPVGADSFAVKGALSASVVQTDVVTLEPVPQDVNEEIALTLLPADDTRAKKGAAEEANPEAIDERDVYRGGKIDLGAIVVEHLALGLDPYPRSPGVEFPGHIESAQEPESSPFAALAKLKPKPE